MVTGEPYYGSSEQATVPEYSGTYAGSDTPGATGTTSTTGSDQMQQSASTVASSVQQAANNLAGQAGDTAHVVLKDQRSNAAQSLNTVSNAISQVGQQLSQNDQTAPIAGVISAAAGQVQNAASYLEHHNVEQIVDEVRNFARREPALFLGGAFLVGLLAARFLKASPESQPPQQSQTYMRERPRMSSQYGASYGASGPRYGRAYGPSGNFRQGPAYRQPPRYGPNTPGYGGY